MDGCGETEYRVENLDDQNKIFYLKSEFGVPRVRIGSKPDPWQAGRQRGPCRHRSCSDSLEALEYCFVFVSL